MKIIEGDFVSRDAKIAIVVSRFNGFLVESLLDAAVDTLSRVGQVKKENITIVRVPGAFEIPLAAKAMAKKGDVDAIVALGAVIQGSTPHFDYVCSSASSGLNDVMLTFDLPVTFGIITTNTIEQAIERSGTKAGNKGADAALAALEMLQLLKHIK